MALRWVGHHAKFLTQPRRVLAVGGGMLSLAALLMSASGTLQTALNGRGASSTPLYSPFEFNLNILSSVHYSTTFSAQLKPRCVMGGGIT